MSDHWESDWSQTVCQDSCCFSFIWSMFANSQMVSSHKYSKWSTLCVTSAVTAGFHTNPTKTSDEPNIYSLQTTVIRAVLLVLKIQIKRFYLDIFTRMYCMAFICHPILFVTSSGALFFLLVFVWCLDLHWWNHVGLLVIDRSRVVVQSVMSSVISLLAVVSCHWGS